MNWAGNVIDALRGSNRALEQDFDRLFAEAKQQIELDKKRRPVTE